MKPTGYLETTIPNYLTAWPSRDLVRAAHQQITREWGMHVLRMDCPMKKEIKVARPHQRQWHGFPIPKIVQVNP